MPGTVNTSAAFNTFIAGNDYVEFTNVVVGSGGGSITFTYQANTSVLIGGVANTIGNFNGLQLVAAAGGLSHARIGFSNTFPSQYSDSAGSNDPIDDWRNALRRRQRQDGHHGLGQSLNERVVYDDRGFNMAAGTGISFGTVSAANLLQIRNDTKAGSYAAATTLAESATTWSGSGQGGQHPGFEMLITTPASGTVTNYTRTCNFETGEISVTWADSRGTWVRKAFVSRNEAPAGDNTGVIVQSLTAPTAGTLTCTIQLTTEAAMVFPSTMTFTHNDSTSFLNLRVNYRQAPARAAPATRASPGW